MKQKTVINKLDRIFSEYIRRRDADENGYATCCTCGKRDLWQDMDAGHFVPRQHKSTRYEETNVHAQCRKCNRFNNGEPSAYALFLMKKYDDDIVQLLESKKQEIHKPNWEEELEIWKEKLEELQ